MEFLKSSVRLISEYDKLAEQFHCIDGFIENIEGYTLMKLASNGHGIGSIVEIGSFLGKSTCWLAIGSKEAQREKITAVDSFLGSSEHQKGAKYECEILVKECTTYNKFITNLQKMNLLDHVIPLVAKSVEAVTYWNKTIRLLFIDADHDYKSVKRDFKLWSPYLIKNGYICFHDIGTWEGPTKFYSELLENDNQYKEILKVASLGVLQKL